jgi:hypothetical protein
MRLKILSRKILAFILSSAMLMLSFNLPAYSAPENNGGQYIVTFSNENAKEKFVKDKNKNKKVKKNFEKQSSAAVELTGDDIAELSYQIMRI